MNNIIFKTDSYKEGHDPMYDEDTTQVYSYFESREGAYFPETVFIGLQPLIKKHLVKPEVPDFDFVRKVINGHIGNGAFNEKWLDMPTTDDGKYFNLPISIRAVPEGTPVPTGNVLMTIENTDKSGDMRFLTNFVESLLTHVWYTSTVASKSRFIKKMIYRYLERTSDNPEDFIDFMLHDFGYRGATSDESGAIGGSAHLAIFRGTDTVPALLHIMENYNTTNVEGFSVYATEHSIMTQYGRAGEMDVVEKLLRNEKYKDGILSIVIDSYDWVNFIHQMGTERFKDLILNRKGQVVFRPDSGDPVSIITRAWGMLDNIFGSTINNKGYRILNPKIRLLWGDGIDIDGVEDILVGLAQIGVSVQDVLFGMGGALLQKVNRDTQRFAFKSSHQTRGGFGYDIYKDPVDGSKKSKPGKLSLIKTDTGFKTVRTLDKSKNEEDELVEVFRNGTLLVDYTWDQVRYNARI